MKIYVSIQCIQEEKKMLCIWYGMHIIHCCIQRSCDIVPNEIDTVTDKFKKKKKEEEATVRTGHGTTDWFKTGKGVHQGCVLSPCLFNLYAGVCMHAC